MTRYFIGCTTEQATENWPMASAGCSGIDDEDYAVSTNHLKGDEVPDACTDAKTFALLMAGLLNAFYSGVNALSYSEQDVMEMGKAESELDIPHCDNVELPF